MTDKVIINGNLWSYVNDNWVKDDTKYNENDLALVIVEPNTNNDTFKHNDKSFEYIFKNGKWKLHKEIMSGITGFALACFYSKIDYNNIKNNLVLNGKFCMDYDNKCVDYKEALIKIKILYLEKLENDYKEFIKRNIGLELSNLVKYSNNISIKDNNNIIINDKKK